MISVWAAQSATRLYQQERTAPGHPYDPRTGSGIEWKPGSAYLWEGGRITERAPHYTASPFESWFWLTFKDVFPAVTHWWFGTAWTGKVWVRAVLPPVEGGPIVGGMTFGDRTQPERPWHIQVGDPPRVATPLPPRSGNACSLTLQLALGQLVWEMHIGNRPSSLVSWPTWANGVPEAPPRSARRILQQQNVVLVTSLVARTALPDVFPLTPGPWYPVGVDRPLRQTFCHSLGLHSPAWLAGH